MTASFPSEPPPFSVDLIENSLKLKWFLQTAHELGVSLRPPSFHSIKRYLDFWLPFVKHHPDLPLIPPADVAWLWHCHRLAPKHYEEYVIGRFDMLLDAPTPFALQYAEAETYSQDSLMTQELWRTDFPNESFFAENGEVGEIPDPRCELPVSLVAGFDLSGSSKRQAGFLWQVSTSSFEDIEFLEQGVINYWKFLLLKPRAQQQGKILVPTYQIDMMWHTHMLSSIAGYNSDCKTIMGSTLHHDDSFVDRSKGGILDLSYQSTKQMWLNEFGTEYVVEGGMYRGEPPASYYSAEWQPTGAPTIVVAHEMGASSTSPNSISPPSKWATVSGVTSDGSPAFIDPKVETGRRTLLINEERKDNYVLGKVKNKVGYFHLETKEAHTIMLSRLKFRIRKLNSDIAMEKSCCGKKRAEVVLEKQVELHRHMDVYDEIFARSRAGSPRGIVGRDPITYTNSTGLWLYPPIVWDSCGGACGGAVACSADVGGASACGGDCGGGSGCGGGCGGCG